MSIILELRTAIRPPYCTENENKIRYIQFENGLKKILSYKNVLLENNCDIYLLDNTINCFNDLPNNLKDIILKYDLNVIYSQHNKFGKFNKGAGDIENLKFIKEKIKNYKWFIHFEPRQLLISYYFFDSFLKNPRNLFTLNNNINYPKHFNTGLYATEIKNILNFIDSISEHDLEVMISKSISIEYMMYDFYINNNINFFTLDKMDLLWFYDKYDPNKFYHW